MTAKKLGYKAECSYCGREYEAEEGRLSCPVCTGDEEGQSKCQICSKRFYRSESTEHEYCQACVNKYN